MLQQTIKQIKMLPPSQTFNLQLQLTGIIKYFNIIVFGKHHFTFQLTRRSGKNSTTKKKDFFSATENYDIQKSQRERRKKKTCATINKYRVQHEQLCISVYKFTKNSCVSKTSQLYFCLIIFFHSKRRKLQKKEKKLASENIC